MVYPCQSEVAHECPQHSGMVRVMEQDQARHRPRGSLEEGQVVEVACSGSWVGMLGGAPWRGSSVPPAGQAVEGQWHAFSGGHGQQWVVACG